MISIGYVIWNIKRNKPAGLNTKGSVLRIFQTEQMAWRRWLKTPNYELREVFAQDDTVFDTSTPNSPSTDPQFLKALSNNPGLKWQCPIDHEGCTKNCGSYGCGN